MSAPDPGNVSTLLAFGEIAVDQFTAQVLDGQTVEELIGHLTHDRSPEAINYLAISLGVAIKRLAAITELAR